LPKNQLLTRNRDAQEELPSPTVRHDNGKESSASIVNYELPKPPQPSAAIMNRLVAGTRSSKNWHSLPGSFDDVNAHILFTANDSDYGIPTIKNERNLPLPEQLVGYGTVRLRNPAVAGAFALHCFVDDYRLAPLWNRPYKTVAGLLNRGYGCVFSPDFSLYRDWPLALQIWNTYRNRWLGAFWQLQGLKVVPTVSWSDKTSYPFCFDGIEPSSSVALSTVGITNPIAKPFFELGFREMLLRLAPKRIFCYGKLSAPLATFAQEGGAEVIQYPSQWEGKRRKLKEHEVAHTNTTIQDFNFRAPATKSVLTHAPIASQSSPTPLPLTEQHVSLPGDCRPALGGVLAELNGQGGIENGR
jgi:Domain of unknown function (DUF4417)